MKQNISFVTIAVNDFDKELTFYQEVLGWKPYNVMDGVIALFVVGSFIFSLCSYKELTDDVGSELATKPYLGVTLAQNLPSETAVDEVFSHLRQTDTTIVKEPTKASWGGYSGYFTDPEGHLWEVAHNPQFKYDADGIMVVPE
jgi:catechol 2,3-dioxygenase-like lactoylglutathione lyase family enzyme